MNQEIITTKRLTLIAVFLSIFAIGSILMNTTPPSVISTYELTTQTDDGVIISFNVFEPVTPAAPGSRPVIILGHGSMVNKEMMKGYALEFASAGFVAIPFDFRGHGQSGDGDRSLMVNDVEAIKDYLDTRTDVDANNVGYLGYSMGGLGQYLINTDTDFKCFIGIGTGLYNSLRTGTSSDNLDVLMIIARYDEAVQPSRVIGVLANRTGVPAAIIDLNRLYGSFENGNASMIYLDDNSNHLFTAWDEDFIREARDWAINSFGIDVIDENFYANFRAIFLLIQIFGGVGFFFLSIDPLSNLILKSKKERDAEIEPYTKELPNFSIRTITIKAVGHSLVVGILGVLLFIPILLILPLAIAGFVSALLFGAAFGILVLMWRLGKKSDFRLRTIFRGVFKGREKVARQIALGAVLTTILYIIAYLSIGLNYLALVPSITKIWTIPIFFAINFVIFIIFNLLTQVMLQNKFGDSRRGLLKAGFPGFIFPFLYFLIYLFVFGIIMRSYFYFGNFMPIASVMFPLTAFVSVVCYKKTGNIIVGSIVNAFILTMLIVTMSPTQTGLAFLMGFLR
jgi:pimeloyl-ACP methyl ester carboxylesterase